MASDFRRSGDAYGDQFAAMFPRGRAWPVDEESVFQRVARAIAMVWGSVDARISDLVEIESDPRTTVELLPEWEAAFGLPDTCVQAPLTISARQRALAERMTAKGGQSRTFFIAVAARLGYTITIREFSPFMCGVSRCGDPAWAIGPAEIRFYWTVAVASPRLTWFRAGAGRAGVDHHLEIGIADDLECLFRRWKPAHTEIAFDYSGSSGNGELAGTP